MRLTYFGNPILREQAQIVSTNDLDTQHIQNIITTIRTMLGARKFGVGLAAPQIGKSIAIAVIDIKPTKTRPGAKPYFSIIVNPGYEGIGRRSAMWEGCLSSGVGNNTLYAKALRYEKIQATWIDENNRVHKEVLTGLPAHVFQHEVDHLNGILFVDKVRDSKTYMLANEFQKYIKKST